MSIKINFDSKDIEKMIRNQANKALEKGVDGTCPNCGKPLTIKTGKTYCSHCKTTMNFTSNI
ncbi:hypothetical protein P7H75_02900 [Vagococcus carniphilus]|uniref:hypothetical protein n=1 Tax=Vagococcus carniphilus TaxID=218144 RepID=UPI00288E9ACF|nr:hypothetical protein [Vagococcus carniphilus]MDT2813780.1 hypothetical protein [Vagococcus carniphilus]